MWWLVKIFSIRKILLKRVAFFGTVAESYGTDQNRRQHNVKFSILLDENFTMNTYAVLILYDNNIVYIETHDSQIKSDVRAVSLANEGILIFGKYRLETIEEALAYYHSSDYYDNGDFTHVCVKGINDLRRMK